jgi:proteasome lid subunit RPN8/RPN11
MVKVALARQSAAGALADQHELQKALIHMDEWGHHLHGLFHSHPGSGAPATQPSSTDLKTHERFERGGYPLVGAIFVNDGVVRFFANHPFTISVYGKGVERVDEHVFTLAPRHLPHQTPSGER